MKLTSFLAIALLTLAGPGALWAQVTPTTPTKKPGEAVTLKAVTFKGDVKPGVEVTAVVQFEIEAGYHVQANPASEPAYIPAVFKLEPAAGVIASPIRYPAGKEEPVAGLPKPLKVYDGTFEILIPLKIKPDAKLPIAIPGLLTYQACKGSTCYPPRKLKVEIPLTSN